MPDVTIDGCIVHYEEMGRGVPIVLTPGGRWGLYVQEAVATALAQDFRVIIWDRPNTDGKSGIRITGNGSEADLWSDMLAGLIRTLKLAPCYVGEYAGCRTAPLLCAKYPDLAKGLLLAWTSGGEAPANSVPNNMYRSYIKAALRDGMEGVIALNHFADTVRHNPANRDALLALDPIDFARQMSFWAEYFFTSADLPIAGCRLGEREWASIRTPASVTGGVDPIHPTAAAQRVAKLLPNSHYHEPVLTLEEWDAVFGKFPYAVTSKLQGERVAPVWRDFVRAMER